MEILTKEDGTKYKIAWVGDIVTPSGFGRIGNEVCRRLVMRGWDIIAASYQWGGYPWADPAAFPYKIFPLGGREPFGNLAGWIAQENPDIVISCQDFPYAETIYNNLRIDWSTKLMVVITPIDGVPIHPNWLALVDDVDATMVISEFGVEAMRMAGKQVHLLHPATNSNEFYPADSKEEVFSVREKIGMPRDAFVVGSFMMNQGRKAIPDVIELFYEFSRDKKNTFLYLDMDKTSPAGWDIPSVIKQMNADPSKLLFKGDAFKVGMTSLRDRYLLCDVTCQLAHREGFGLPNIESQACKLPVMVLDWCSGSEIAGEERGILVRRIDYMTRGTWGGARDAFPDMRDALAKLNAVYYDADLRQKLGNNGYKYATSYTWDMAADSLETVIKNAIKLRKSETKQKNEGNIYVPGTGLADEGDSRATRGYTSTPTNAVDCRSVLQELTTADQAASVDDQHSGDGQDTDNRTG
jgi:glycosyltransferase involved in cell wall biosynthesis